MKRFVMIYLPLLVIGALVWPALKGTGAFELPGDVLLTVDSTRIGAPFTTSLIVALSLFGIWRILEP